MSKLNYIIDYAVEELIGMRKKNPTHLVSELLWIKTAQVAKKPLPNTMSWNFAKCFLLGVLF